MTTGDTAIRVWQVLIAAAHQQKTVRPETLAEMLGLPGDNLQAPLGRLRQYCAENRWPLITGLVVPEGVASPAPEAALGRDALAEQERIFGHRWFTMPPFTEDGQPPVEQPAKRPCPNCGREGNAAATLCGYCWIRLTPQVEGSPSQI